MKTIEHHEQASSSLQKGQKWEMKESNISISLVGKRLVHYKHFKNQAKRATVSLASIPTLEKYLQENEAVLAPPQ